MRVLLHRGLLRLQNQNKKHCASFSSSPLALGYTNSNGQYQHSSRSFDYSTRTAQNGHVNFHLLSSSNFNHHHHLQTTIQVKVHVVQIHHRRSYSSTPKPCQSQNNSQESITSNDKREQQQQQIISSSSPKSTSTLIYEGPFASLSQRLKRISITTAIISIVGVPLLVTFHSGDVPASGQFAVGATAIIAATGSTAALSYCFSPYVKTLSYITNDIDTENGTDSSNIDFDGKMVKATTINLFAMEKTTIFNPDIDVSLPSKTKTYRPFCNFMVRDEPFYIHPELLHDDELRVKLLGEEKGTLVKVDDESEEKKKKLKKDLDDDFL